MRCRSLLAAGALPLPNAQNVPIAYFCGVTILCPDPARQLSSFGRLQNPSLASLWHVWTMTRRQSSPLTSNENQGKKAKKTDPPIDTISSAAHPRGTELYVHVI
mmetsp:Transcript_96/g.158  ORF Transcript_96/g.158 Transcript_96/m.158 type:complete len:104 (-) Transcript_96:138-449(-)